MNRLTIFEANEFSTIKITSIVGTIILAFRQSLALQGHCDDSKEKQKLSINRQLTKTTTSRTI
jgi:hypothetical protein